MNVSLFRPPIKNIAPIKNITLKQVINAIKSDALKDITEKVRAIDNKTERDEVKCALLPSVTFSGTFKHRRKGVKIEDKLISLSGHMCVDIDGLSDEELPIKRELLKKDKHTFALFISPSGHGLKVIIKVPVVNPEQHKQCYMQYGEYLKKEYELLVDEKAKDITRVTFLCHDPDAYYNYEGE